MRSITAALRDCLRDEITEAAYALSSHVERHGVKVAAANLLSEFGHVH
jgi:hypothetical protein